MPFWFFILLLISRSAWCIVMSWETIVSRDIPRAFSTARALLMRVDTALSLLLIFSSSKRCFKRSFNHLQFPHATSYASLSARFTILHRRNAVGSLKNPKKEIETFKTRELRNIPDRIRRFFKQITGVFQQKVMFDGYEALSTFFS